MPSPYTTAGFYHTPISKILVGSSILSYIVVTFPLHNYRSIFVYDTNRIFLLKEVWRLLFGKLVFQDAKDMLLGTLLFYNFRMFERRYGSRKFSSYLLATGLVATGLEVLLVYICRRLQLDIGVLPSGPLCLIYPLFVPHFCDLPRVAVAHLWGIPVTGKSLTYIIGLQLASGSVESFMVAACGIAAGMMFRSDFMRIQSLLYIPAWLGKLCHSVMGRLLESPPPRLTEVSQGATLEIQRLQQTERLEQQIQWAQMRPQPRRPRWGFNFGLPHPLYAAPHPANGRRANSANTNLRHRSNTSADNPDGRTENISEDQVTRLCEMGFNRDRVLQALHISNNDISMATTFLLQDS